MSNGSSKAAVHLSRTQEYQRATSDYARLRKAEQEKTVRLRALRLAKEAADREAADEAAAAKVAAKKPASKCRKGIVTLIKNGPNFLLVREAKPLKMSISTIGESPRFRCESD